MSFSVPSKVLDFDIENRPLSYWFQGNTTAEVTAIAACWVGNPKSMKCWLLGRHDPKKMLQHFVEMYDKADVVIGHFIRGHDLPILNGAMLDYGLPPLKPKLTHDTKLDLVKKKDLSASLEDLSEMFGLKHHKLHISNTEWRQANRLKRSGIATARERATSDVTLHMELYPYLRDGGYLKAPKVWTP